MYFYLHFTVRDVTDKNCGNLKFFGELLENCYFFGNGSFELMDRLGNCEMDDGLGI
jgi:hypothetical protein